MPATIHEKFRSISGDLQSRRVGYIVKGASSDSDALTALEGSPFTWDGLGRTSVAIEELSGPSTWDGIVTYGNPSGSNTNRPPAETGSIEYIFETTVQTKRIYTSLSTVNRYVAAGQQTADFFGQIAVDMDGIAQGADILEPVSQFSVIWRPAIAVVTDAYQKTLRQTVGKVNSDTFFTHSPGEVIFMGASGRSRSVTDWEITYKFGFAQNRDNLPAVAGITVTHVDGWDLLWPHYTQAKDAGKNIMILKPDQFNVERVYQRANFFATLGFSHV